ncbi:MAG: pyridoxal-phosphate dependent enzyme, partial [Candidatus Bathyarchaeia archaeon]
PLVRAFEQGHEESEFWEGAETIAPGLRVPKALGDFLILQAVRESGGTAVAVSDEEIMDAVGQLAAKEGIFACPEGAATLAAMRRLVDGGEVDLDGFSRVFGVGGGKAGGAMAEAVEALLGDRIACGVVNVLGGEEGRHPLKRIELLGASHPIPDEEGVRGAGRMLSLVEEAGEDDLVIVLISGGGSALMTHPADGVGLEELQALTERLLRSGATINELNAVRKHLSSFKGGQLAERAHPATVISLILSDVVGDPLDTIASGPTAPDPTTFKDAVDVLRRRGLWERAADSIRRRLEDGVRGRIGETPKPGDAAFEKVFNVVVGSNLTAAEAAVERAAAMGYHALLLSTRVEGEARHVGTVYAGIALEVEASGHPVPKPAAIVVGGETTVTVRGSGRGGRNQELALSAAAKIEGVEAVIAALATDGIDGPTEAAGAVVDGWTAKRARAMGLNPGDFLRDNDSHGFFSALGDAIMTGPTGTNVNDLAGILVSG